MIDNWLRSMKRTIAKAENPEATESSELAVAFSMAMGLPTGSSYSHTVDEVTYMRALAKYLEASYMIQIRDRNHEPLEVYKKYCNTVSPGTYPTPEPPSRFEDLVEEEKDED
jgi:hypothetical protein